MLIHFTHEWWRDYSSVMMVLLHIMYANPFHTWVMKGLFQCNDGAIAHMLHKCHASVVCGSGCYAHKSWLVLEEKERAHSDVLKLLYTNSISWLHLLWCHHFESPMWQWLVRSNSIVAESAAVFNQWARSTWQHLRCGGADRVILLSRWRHIVFNAIFLLEV